MQFFCITDQKVFPQRDGPYHKFCKVVCDACRLHPFAGKLVDSFAKSHVCQSRQLCFNQSCRAPMVTFDAKTKLGRRHLCTAEIWTDSDTYSSDDDDKGDIYNDNDMRKEQKMRQCECCKHIFSSVANLDVHQLNLQTANQVETLFLPLVLEGLPWLPDVLGPLIVEYTSPGRDICDNLSVCIGCGVYQKDLFNHQKICKQLMTCPACCEYCEKSTFDSLHKPLCIRKKDFEIVACPNCNLKIESMDATRHATFHCPAVCIKCDQCGTKKVKRGDMEQHKTTVCPMQPKPTNAAVTTNVESSASTAPTAVSTTSYRHKKQRSKKI